MIPPSATNAAGNRRRARRDQKWRRSTRPVESRSTSSSVVIRNPESVKNALTPRKPPRAHAYWEWKRNTAATARPRRPSRAGR
jgi:hypothetical protein